MRNTWTKRAFDAVFVTGASIAILLLVLLLAVSRFLTRPLAARTRESDERYRQLVDLFPEAVYAQTDGTVRVVNAACMKLFGAAHAAELVGRSAIELFDAAYREVAQQRIGSMAAADMAATRFEAKIARLDNRLVDVEVLGASFRYQGTLGTQVVMRDISRRKKAEARISYLAQHDSLTALPNRTLFRDRLTHAIANAKRSGQTVGIMLLGLDHFKEINGSLGSTVGDKILQAVARLLDGILREVDTVARLGSDEFAIVVEQAAGMDHLSSVAERILQALSDPIIAQEQEIFVTMSMGIAVYPLHGDDADGLLRTASLALHHARQAGRSTYELYSSGDGRERLRRPQQGAAAAARARASETGTVLHLTQTVTRSNLRY